MSDSNPVTKNIIKSYSENISFPVYSAEELEKMYISFKIDPTSTDRRVFDTESMSHHVQRQVIKLFEMIGISQEDLVLDAGCGNGAPTRLMAKLYKCKIVGFDINPLQIEKAVACDRLEKVSQFIDRKVDDVHLLKFKDSTFDKIFHNETICHWEHKKLALSHLYRVLKPGGIMGFHDWTSGDKGDLNDAKGGFPGTYAEGVWFQNSIDETCKLLEDVGFKIIQSENTTDIVDRGLHARLRELELSHDIYLKGASKDYYEKSLRYFQVMINTHNDYLKYARFICKKV